MAATAQDVNFYTREKESALGAGLAQEISKYTAPLDSSAVRDYIASLGRQLASQLPDTGLNWRFTPVFESSGGRTHEPIALPGGFIFVSASLILDAQNEAEFAGMLAHAMAHVSERHGIRMAPRGQIANLGTIPLIFMRGWGGAGDGEAAFVPIGFLKSQRSNELAADRLAVQITAGAGFDPAALERYIDRMQPASTDPPPDRSGLPSHDERIAALQEAIQDFPAASYASANEEFRHIQAEVRSLMPVRRPPSLLHQ